ncbi:MAG: SPOR domain-containing protein, partial [Methylococcales bacterium]|nr:SPOR domain-containing protein [Methylococcales bacterium]
ATLFAKVAVGTEVRILHQPYLAAWFRNRLYIQAYAPLEKWAGGKAALQNEFRNKLETLAVSHRLKLQWPAVQAVLDRADGLPVAIDDSGNVEAVADAGWLEHPWKLRGTFIPARVGEDDWSVRTEGAFDQDTAKKLAEMLNHQGPAIPSYPMYEDGGFLVISGPFGSQAEAEKTARKIEQDFEIISVAVPPAIKSIPDAE